MATIQRQWHRRCQYSITYESCASKLGRQCFQSLENAFRSALNRRTIVVQTSTRNDIYTLCELLKLSYYESVTPLSIIAGFRVAGLWVPEKHGPDQSKVRAQSYTSLASSLVLSLIRSTRASLNGVGQSRDPSACIQTSNQLDKSFL